MKGVHRVKLVVAVVPDEHSQSLSDHLIREGFSSTKLASTGGFFRAGNATFLIGVAANQAPRVMEIIRTSSSERRAHESIGTTVFVLDVEKMVKC